MKLGVSSYSFTQALHDGRLTMDTLIDKAAEMGFETLDFAVPVLADETMEQAAPRLGKRCRDAGVECANYAVGADFLRNGIDEEVERLKKELDIAALLGAKTFRHDATGGFPAEKKGARSFDAALPYLVEGYSRVTEYAKTLGIVTLVENHGFFAQDSDRVEKLVCAVDNENFGALVDMGNFLCADENPLHAFARMAPYAYHVHAKDFLYKAAGSADPGQGWFKNRVGAYLRGTIVGHGVVPIAQNIAILKQLGYDGTLAIEFEGMEDCFKALAIGLENLKAYCE